jgi:hypothetical protein
MFGPLLRFTIVSVVVTISSLFLSSCDNAQPKKPWEIAANRQFATPEKDVTLSIAKGDLSLRAVYGYSVSVPGLREDYFSLQKKYNIKVIPHTSDITDYNDPNSYNTLARHYAFQYNRFMLGKLGCDFSAPMNKCRKYPP